MEGVGAHPTGNVQPTRSEDPARPLEPQDARLSSIISSKSFEELNRLLSQLDDEIQKAANKPN